MPGPAAEGPDDLAPVLHLLAPAPAGGLERVVRALAKAQAARGRSVTIGAILAAPVGRDRSQSSAGDAGSAVVAALAAPGVEVVPISVPGRSYWHERRAVLALAARRGARVAHTHGYRPDVVDAGALRAHGLRTVSTVHGFTGGSWRNRLYQELQRRAFRRFDAVVVVSEVMARELMAAGISAAHLQVIPNAYGASVPLLSREAARAALALPSEAYVVGWVGRLSREKGLDVLLEAAALAHGPGQDGRRTTSAPPSGAGVRQGDAFASPLYAVIGDGRERERLTAQAAHLGIAADVRWLGLLDEAAAYYRAFDLFVLSSRTEGTPIALLEAMDAEVPIVTTAVGGVPAVVSSAEAILVPSEDPGSLAAALHTVRSDPGAARRRAVAARERLLSAYGIDAWLARYDAVYAAVCAGRGARSDAQGPAGPTAAAPRDLRTRAV